MYICVYVFGCDNSLSCYTCQYTCDGNDRLDIFALNKVCNLNIFVIN